MSKINRDGRKKRELRNLIKRGRVWYFKKMVEGKIRPVSLGTEDLELAKAKRNALEQQALAGEWEKIQGPRASSGTLQEVFDAYEEIGGLMHQTLLANRICLLQVVRVGSGRPELEASEVKLSELTRRLVRDYQDAVRRKYEAEAGSDEKARRMARDLADRTSKSTFNQGKSVFCKKRSLIERYREKGIEVPESIHEFLQAGAVGKMTSKVYFPPSDTILAETFRQVEVLKGVDREAYYMFWGALGTGCRRSELADMKCEDLVELDGRLWVGAGLGKDGNLIQIPVIDWPVHGANGTVPAAVLRELLAERRSGPLLLGGKTERHDALPDRLNRWLGSLGWRDEKKLHGLRAYIGSKIYSKNPRLAQLYLRHKSIATTERFYSHFLALNGAFEFRGESSLEPVLVVLPAAVGKN